MSDSSGNSGSTGNGPRAGLYLIDTSVWIPVLRPGALGQALAPRVAALVTAQLAATSDAVLLEILRGARDSAEYDRLEVRLAPLPILPVTAERWREAARLGFDLARRHGLTVASIDLLIAAVAVAHGATLVHRDGDFDLIAQHAPLLVESHV